jgi:acyl carrier protein
MKRIFLVLLAAALCVPAYSQDTELTFAPADTSIHWTLPTRLHTVHGTFKLKEGRIRFDRTSGAASGQLIVDAVSGESGSGSRDSRMHSSIIESKKFSVIVFRPDRVRGQIPEQGAGKIDVHGMFELHGTMHELTIPVEVQVETGSIGVKSHFKIPYVEWGLKDPSVIMLKVDNTVEIEMSLPPQADSVSTRVIAVLARMQKIPVESITAENSFADLGIDSLDGLRIIFELEEEFGVDIPDQDIKQYTTVALAAQGVTQLLALKASQSGPSTAA